MTWLLELESSISSTPHKLGYTAMTRLSGLRLWKWFAPREDFPGIKVLRILSLVTHVMEMVCLTSPYCVFRYSVSCRTDIVPISFKVALPFITQLDENL